MKISAFPAMLTLTILAACSPGSDGTPTDDTWVGTITTEGNVTTVVNEAGSVWGGTATLVEEASIGVDAGADEYLLGSVLPATPSATPVSVEANAGSTTSRTMSARSAPSATRMPISGVRSATA
jgi:hypothetical protein